MDAAVLFCDARFSVSGSCRRELTFGTFFSLYAIQVPTLKRFTCNTALHLRILGKGALFSGRRLSLVGVRMCSYKPKTTCFRKGVQPYKKVRVLQALVTGFQNVTGS